MTSRHSLVVPGSLLFVIVFSACLLTPSTLPAATAPGRTGPTGTAGAGCANAYYPILSAASWSYASTGSTSVGDYTYTRTVGAAGANGFTTNDHYSTGVNWTVTWTCRDGNLTALDTGSGSASLTTSRVNLSDTTVTSEGYNIPAAFDPGATWSEKVSIKGPVKSNGKVVANSEIDAQLECTAGNPASVTVPAGTFNAVTAACSKTVTVSALAQGNTMRLGANHENITYWYAKGVGLVKSVATGGTDNETIVLTAYHLP